MGDNPPPPAVPAAASPPEPPKPAEKVPEKTVKKSKRWLRAQIAKQGIGKRTRRAKTAIAGAYGSHAYYNNLWADSMKEMRYLMAEEKKRSGANADRKKMFELIFTVYLKYLKVYKSMDEIYDQMVHPQKRILVRKMLDLIIGRLLELQHNLVLCEYSEVYYLDELAAFEGLMPRELDMPIPKYYFYDPTPEMIQRDQWFSNVKDRRTKAKKDEEEQKRKEKLKAQAEAEERGWGPMGDDDVMMTYDDVMPVQIMERARQAKGRYYVGRYYNEEEMAYKKKKDKGGTKMDIEKAAKIIQKIVRGFLARQRVKKIRNQELEFLGLRPTSQNFSTDFSYDFYYRFNNDKCSTNAETLEKIKESRRKLRRLKQTQYEDAQVQIHKQMRLIEGPDMAERFKYQIRSWFLNVKEEKGKFPDIPKAEFGGSRLMICPETLPEDVLEKGKEATDPDYAAKKKKERQKEKEKAKKEKEKRKKEKAKNKGKKGKKKGTETPNPALEQPANYDDFKQVNLEYNKIWRGLDDKDNPDQNYEKKYIIREKRQEVALEVRIQVDIAMKAELDYLKKVLEKKKGKKGKKGKGKKGKGKGKKGKGKKGKKGKKKGKKKKKKDMTANRTMESLFEELVRNRVIHQYPKIRMKDLVAQCSLINADLRSYHAEHPMSSKLGEWFMPGDVNPAPSFGDTLKAIKDICILPLGSVEVHEQQKDLVKSILIVGPPGSGKRTLVNMICTELKATLFDLTAKNITGRYPEKAGLKMLWHLIDKVGHAMQPVIILIDNCEKMYQKKTPEDDQKSEPKRLKKTLKKFLKKSIGPNDLYLLIGLSSEPWKASFKPIKKTYQKIIYIPPPDYGTRFAIWKKCLSTHPDELGNDIHYSLLTKLSAGWSAGSIMKTCNDVIQNLHKDMAKQKRERRKDMDPWGHLGNLVTRQTSIGKMSVSMNKLLECIAQYDPVFLEQEKCWNKWWNKTPLMKARLATQIGGGGDKKKKKKDKGKRK